MIFENTVSEEVAADILAALGEDALLKVTAPEKVAGVFGGELSPAAIARCSVFTSATPAELLPIGWLREGRNPLAPGHVWVFVRTDRHYAHRLMISRQWRGGHSWLGAEWAANKYTYSVSLWDTRNVSQNGPLGVNYRSLIPRDRLREVVLEMAGVKEVI